MADIEQLKRALVNADKAGDTQAATKLAQALKAEMANQPTAQQADNGPVHHSMILPFNRDDKGVHFSTDEGVLGMAKRFVQYPGQVMRGEIDPLSDQGIARNLEWSMMATPANPAIRAGDRAIPGPSTTMRKTGTPVPTSQSLKELGGSQLDAMRGTGVTYSSPSVAQTFGTFKHSLETQGFLPDIAPKTHKVLDALANPPAGSTAPIAGLHTARQVLRKIAGNFNDPNDQAAAQAAIKAIDEFIAKPPEKGVLAGPASEASRLLKEGNANYAAGKQSEKITGVKGIATKAKLRASAANSGQNLGNSIRQNVASVLSDPKARAGFTPEEIAALDSIVKGTFAANATRRVGNLLGGGGGLGGAVTAGGAGALAGSLPAGMAAGAAVLGTGAGAKYASNEITLRALMKVDEMIRMRSPAYADLVRKTPALPGPTTSRAAAVKMLEALMPPPNSYQARPFGPNDA